MSQNWKDYLKRWEEKNDSLSKRKQGSFWTPPLLAQWMAEWIKEKNPASVLDPAGGCGNLLQPFADFDSKLYTAEIDKDLRQVLRKRFPDLKIYNDFWKIPRQEKYDAIISNPPYISHTLLPDLFKETAHAQIKKDFNVSLPKTTNLSILFYIESWRRLNKGGRMIFLIPNEFQQIVSGETFKDFLVSSSGGQAHQIIDLETNTFGKDVLSTACLVLAEKKDAPNKEVLFSTANLNSLSSWAAQEKEAKRIRREEINTASRWKSACKTIKYKTGSQSFSEIASIKPGHITGNNNLFLISYPEAKLKGLENSVEYCLLRPQQLPTRFFHTDKQIEEIKATDSKRWLIKIGENPNSAEEEFLSEAESLGFDKRKTQAARNPWWEQKNSLVAEPADFILPNFRRDFYYPLAYLKRNKPYPIDFFVIPNSVSLTKDYQQYFEIIFLWLLTTQGQSALKENERDAGNGLYTIRSGALKDVRLPLFHEKSAEWQKEMKSLFSDFKKLVLKGQGIKEIIHKAERLSEKL